jgi:hypothetical protein
VFSPLVLMSEVCRSKVCFAQYLGLSRRVAVVIKHVSPSSSLTYHLNPFHNFKPSGSFAWLLGIGSTKGVALRGQKNETISKYESK